MVKRESAFLQNLVYNSGTQYKYSRLSVKNNLMGKHTLKTLGPTFKKKI